MPSDGSQERAGGGEYENINATAQHAHISQSFRISHSFQASGEHPVFFALVAQRLAPLGRVPVDNG
jgi:hypothetical protein